jgi:hypothetical protein
MMEGFRVLFSRRFWRGFLDHWSGDAISGRLDEFTSRVREQTGQDPDWDVERRRSRRGKRKP